MRVLLIGSGGREHALARGLARDSAVTDLHAAPGNPGIAGIADLHEVTPTDPAAVTSRAGCRADLVVIGPEAPLVAGVADAVRSAGIRCFGPEPGRRPALEGSKSFAKDVMTAAGIPTARARDLPRRRRRGLGTALERVRAALCGEGGQFWRRARASS